MATKQLTLGELTQRLALVPLPRRQAILFALDTGLSIEKVIDLTWQQIPQIPVTPLAQDILRSVPRHIRLNYVFWETLPNDIAAPLFGLAQTALQVSNREGFKALSAQYKKILLIDTDADCDEFLDVLIDVRNGMDKEISAQ